MKLSPRLIFENGLSRKDLLLPVGEIKDLCRGFGILVPGEAKFCATFENYFDLQKPPALEVSVLFCDDVLMRRFQKKYRRLDRTTDVLSFPAFEMFSAQEYAKQKLPFESLGDLIISLPTVKRGALRAKRTPSKELREVLVHGLLHLCGYDHIKSAKAAREMFRLQKALLKKLSQPQR